MQKTLIIKLSVIMGLCLIFAVGLNMISSLIYERQAYSDQVIKEIAEQHVKPQQVITPFITIPTTITPACNKSSTDKNKKCQEPYEIIDTLFATQTSSTQKLDVSTDTYKRGIYHATSYNGDLTFNQNYALSAKISPTDQPNAEFTDKINSVEIDTKRVAQWEQARLIIPVSDLRGITTLPTVTINKHKVKATYPQSPKLSKLNYIEVKLPIDIIKKLDLQATDTNKPPQIKDINLTINTTLPLAGINTLSIVPTGQNFELNMTSDWHAPNFIGEALPSSKNFIDQGFTANWQNQFLSINNNQDIADCFAKNNRECHIDTYMPLLTSAQLNDREYHEKTATSNLTENYYQLSGFGVSFAEPNDVYLKTERTMKYALLIILVSFGTFFLFEVLKSSRIHPIQYLLVGCALVTFYVLLLPLAEQIPFWMAYAVAATACVGLIGWYSYYMLGSVKRGLMFTAILGSLYAAFYGILTTKDLNLLLGALFCFALLACVMIMTRKIDWYNVA